MSSRAALAAPSCWLAKVPGAGACDGRLVRAHLIPKQRIKREYPMGVLWAPGQLFKIRMATATTAGAGRESFDVVTVRSTRFAPGHVLHDVTPAELDAGLVSLDGIVWDQRCWVPACGGLAGSDGHHGALDSRRLRLTREQLPDAIEQFADDFDMTWSLDRDYGPRRAAA